MTKERKPTIRSFDRAFWVILGQLWSRWRMRDENGWGTKRIHGELLMLGIDVSERTVSRCLRHLPSRRARGQRWRTFLRNHREVIAAMDFFTVFTATFRLLHVLVVIRHGRRKIVHFNVSDSPSPAWVVQ